MDWAGINIRNQSQGVQKEADSIQARVIAPLVNGDFDMVIDDDGKGEAADVVTIKLIRVDQGRPVFNSRLGSGPPEPHPIDVALN
ncbi:MAG: hypothetical protein WCA38_00865 [Candidatus Acidiferrales bacterium]